MILGRDETMMRFQHPSTCAGEVAEPEPRSDLRVRPADLTSRGIDTARHEPIGSVPVPDVAVDLDIAAAAPARPYASEEQIAVVADPDAPVISGWEPHMYLEADLDPPPWVCQLQSRSGTVAARPGCHHVWRC